MERIFYFSEDTSFQLNHKEDYTAWITSIIQREKNELESLNYIFCSDQYLLRINHEYLRHDYFTDIVTFNQSETTNVIEGEIYVSIDRVKENSNHLKKDFQEELSRVMIHGVLHLLGFDDKTEIQKEQMRKKEEACLSLLKI